MIVIQQKSPTIRIHVAGPLDRDVVGKTQNVADAIGRIALESSSDKAVAVLAKLSVNLRVLGVKPLKCCLKPAEIHRRRGFEV
jgi:hypothetical protein